MTTPGDASTFDFVEVCFSEALRLIEKSSFRFFMALLGKAALFSCCNGDST